MVRRAERALPHLGHIFIKTEKTSKSEIKLRFMRIRYVPSSIEKGRKSMNQITKKAISLLLAILMIVSQFPVNAFAQEGNGNEGGSRVINPFGNSVPETYTVTFNGNKRTIDNNNYEVTGVPGNQSGSEGTTITLSSAKPTARYEYSWRTTYYRAFIGWNTKADGTGTY